MGLTRAITVTGSAVTAGVIVGLGVFGGGGGDTVVTVAPAGTQDASDAVTDPGCVSPAGGPTGARLPRMEPDQVANAKKIIAAANAKGVGEAGARIGVAAALVEGVHIRGEDDGKKPPPIAGLRNVAYGHSSSVGIFQELAGSGSGFNLTTAQRMDVSGAAGRFYTKLKAVPGWQNMDPGRAAQRVQRSAYPARYGQRMGDATAIVAALSAGVTGAKACAPGAGPATVPASCPATGSGAERGLRPNALRGLRCGKAAFPWVKQMGGLGSRPNKSDHPMGRAVDFMTPAWNTPAGNAKGWQQARWFEKNAASLNVKYIIFDDKVWRPSGRKAGWRAYTHPNGRTTNPTLRHLDHVHVSFND